MTPETLSLTELPIGRIVRILALTVLSGLADAQGFVHAAQAFQSSVVGGPHLVKAVICLTLGLVGYLFAVRDLMRVGIDAPEIHLLFWLAVTLVGLAIFSGRITAWAGVDRAVAASVVMGISWLICRVE